MKLSDRSIGWLRYLHRKAHTEDNWSQFGHPHPHWDAQPAGDARSHQDAQSGAPMAGGRRMDLVDSSYAMGLMAHTTPAWTEPFRAVLDQLIDRHTGWWAMHDADPETDPSVLDPSVSMLVLLGMRSMVDASGENAAIHAAAHTETAEQIAALLLEASGGTSLGGTSLDGLTAAGLGLKLHDSRHGSSFHQRVHQPVWEDAVDNHAVAGGAWPISATLLGAPQYPADARRLFEAACSSAGLDEELSLPLVANRTFSSALILAREWGMTELEQRLVTAIEASYEPTWKDGEFTWGMGLNEPHPRGRFNAFLAAAEVAGPGKWEQLSATPLDPCPQVVDVDFPNMAFERAEWIDGNLHLGLAPREPDPSKSTFFRVVGAEPRMWDIHGVESARLESRMSGLNVRVPMVKADVTLIRSSY